MRRPSAAPTTSGSKGEGNEVGRCWHAADSRKARWTTSAGGASGQCIACRVTPGIRPRGRRAATAAAGYRTAGRPRSHATMPDLVSELAALVGAQHRHRRSGGTPLLQPRPLPWDDAPVALAVVAPGGVDDCGRWCARRRASTTRYLVTRGGGMSTGRFPHVARNGAQRDRRPAPEPIPREIQRGRRRPSWSGRAAQKLLAAALPKGLGARTQPRRLSVTTRRSGGALWQRWHGFEQTQGVLGVEVVRANGDVALARRPGPRRRPPLPPPVQAGQAELFIG